MDQMTVAAGAVKPKNTTNSFLQDVLKGLSAREKFLESKYFYDHRGDELFREIMNCSEYYPTDCEHEIFTTQTQELARALSERSEEFDVVELGAGDATKSIHLLEELHKREQPFTYYPVDISKSVIELLNDVLPEKLPGLKMQGLNGEYFEMLTRSRELSDKIKIVLFLGGNIGNIPHEEAHHFCTALRSHLSVGDMVLIGFDLKKDPRTILAAYNDRGGFTREFNLNLLKRINNELGGNFELDHFYHYPTYDPNNGACKSYLVSTRNQEVVISGQQIFFKEGETIFMEISQKYTPVQTDQLAYKSGFMPVGHLYDSKGWFLDAIWQCV